MKWCVSADRQTTESDAVYFVGYKYPVVPCVSQLEWTAGRVCPVLITCNYSETEEQQLQKHLYTSLITLHSFSRTCDNMLIFHMIMMNKLLWIQLYCDFSGMMETWPSGSENIPWYLIFVVCWRPEVGQALCETNVSLHAQTRLDPFTHSYRMNAALYEALPTGEWRAQLSSRALTSCSS